MFITNVEDLLARRRTMRLSNHALREAHKEGLRARDIFYAVFNGRLLEHYPERERVLIAGPLPQLDLAVHVVCEYSDPVELVAITIYIPDRPKWVNAVLRAHGSPPSPRAPGSWSDS